VLPILNRKTLFEIVIIIHNSKLFNDSVNIKQLCLISTSLLATSHISHKTVRHTMSITFQRSNVADILIKTLDVCFGSPIRPL